MASVSSYGTRICSECFFFQYNKNNVHKGGKCMNRQVMKRFTSSLLAAVLVVSSIGSYSARDYDAAAGANDTNKLHYTINCDTQQLTTTGEIPYHHEIRPGKIRHDAYDNSGKSGRSTPSFDYTVKMAYKTTNNKIVYPGEQIMCIDHWTAYGSGGSVKDIAVMQSYGLSFMMGNFAAKWENYDAKIPREPRIDLLTNNTNMDAYRDPDNWKGENGDDGAIVVPPPPEVPDEDAVFPTELSFAAKTESGKAAEVSFINNVNDTTSQWVTVNYMIIPAEGTLIESMRKHGVTATAVAEAKTSETYASTEVPPPPSGNKGFPPGYYVIPYIKTTSGGKTVYNGLAASTITDIQMVKQNSEMVSLKGNTKLDIKSIDPQTLPLLGNHSWWHAGDATGGPNVPIAYWWMGAHGSINHTSFDSLARNNRVITLKDYSRPRPPVPADNCLFGIFDWKFKPDNLFSATSDLDFIGGTRNLKTTASNLLENATSLLSVIKPFKAAGNGNFKNIPSIKLNTGDYVGFPFATAYKGSPTAKNASYYEPFYSLLSIELYNFYSHNNLFSHVLPNGVAVPRYFAGSGMGAKTAVADKKLQGDTHIQPFWSWSNFKNAHGAHYAFCGNMAYDGNMPNGRTADHNSQRLMLLAEYINNKMTRDVTPDAMTKIASLPPQVNNRNTFESAVTWNTDITMKWNDPQDLHKMFHFDFKNRNAYKSSYENSSFLVTDEDGKVTKTAPDDYMLVGPFYAHTDFPESRLHIGFSKKVDVGSLAEAGDEIITETLPDGSVVADYVILTSEAVVNNRGIGGSDRRKEDIYPKGTNTTEYAHPLNDNTKLMQSWNVVNGNVPMTNADLKNFKTASPHEVVKHEPTYWDGTTTERDIYDAKLNGTANPKFIINNWGKGEFYIAVRRTANNMFANDLPQVTVGYEVPSGTITQTSKNLKGTSHSGYYQGFAISDYEPCKSSAIIDLNLKLAKIKLNKTDKKGVALDRKRFYLYRLADLNPQLPETDPNRFKWVRYIPVNANMGSNVHPNSDTYYPITTDKQGNIEFDGLIPGWYMIFEKVDHSFRKVSYLQTNDPNEPERQGRPIEMDTAGHVDEQGRPYKQSVTLPIIARGDKIQIDDPLNDNPERAGDIFYVDNGIIKGINMAGTNTMGYNMYGNVINDPVIFYKMLKGVNNLVDEEGNNLNLTTAEYQRNIQFVFQAEEHKDRFYVAQVLGNEINMRDAEMHMGSFPAEDQWIPFGTGEKVDKYWWIDSHKVRIEEHINPALGISKKQVKQITELINTGRYDNDLMAYSNVTGEDKNEFFENKIEEISIPLMLRVTKEDEDTRDKLAGAAFTLHCPQLNVYAKSDNSPHATIPNAYVTDTNGIIEFYIEDDDPKRMQQLRKATWVLTEVEAPEGYQKLTDPIPVYFTNAHLETVTLHGKPAQAMVLDRTVENIPTAPALGELTVRKEWNQYTGGSKVPMENTPTATFRLYRGHLGDKSKLLEEFTISKENPTWIRENLPLETYWIEEVNIPEGMTVSYSPSQQFNLRKENPKVTIHAENVKQTPGEYTIALSKKKSIQSSMFGTADTAYSTLPNYKGPAQFHIAYNGPKGTWETTVTYDITKVDQSGYLKIKVPYAGDYSISEINTPEGYVPEIKIGTTGVDWTPFGPDAPFHFQVPDEPGDAVSLYLQVANNHPASFTVIKRDRETGNRIWDPEMELTMYEDNNGQPSGKRIGLPQKMGEDGKFVFSTQDGYTFEVGDVVWLVETNPPKKPDGAVYKAEPLRVQVSKENAHDNVIIEMTNEIQKTPIKVTKVGPNQEPIQGAIFEVYSDRECQHLLGTGISKENGEVDFKLEGKGPFFVKEVFVPEPYILDETVHEVTPEENTITNLAVTNKKKFSVVVHKVDADTNKPIAGVEFMLYNSAKEPYMIDGNVVTGVTDATGTVVWSSSGTTELTVTSDELMYLRETKVPGGYFTPKEDFVIDLKNTQPNADGFYEGSYEFTFKNNPLYGLRIKKTEVLEHQPGTPAEANGIKGITFKIYNSKDTLVSTQVTDDNGVIELKGLPKDNYYAIEEVPEGSPYEPTKEKIPLTILQLNENGDFADVTWNTYNWVQNALKKGSVSLLKKDDKGALLPGVTFGIYKYNGTGTPNEFNPEECTLIKSDITDGMGKIKFDNLELGKYWIVELSEMPTYIKAKPVLVEVTPTDPNRHLTVTIINERIPASLKVVKIDNETKKPIQGVKFTLSDGVNTFTGVTDRDGVVRFTNLQRNKKYTLVEVEAPDGYIINNKPVDITLGELDTELTITLDNSKYKGKVEIEKISGEDRRPIAGAKFQLYANGTPLGEPKTTDDNGIVAWENLTIGPKYEVQETYVPKPYILDSKKIPVEFTKDDTGVVLFKKTITNEVEKWYVRLWKIDAATSNPLTGAKFDLYMADKVTKLNTTPIVVGPDGMTEPIQVPREGIYYFKETKAPDGFVLDTRFFEAIAYSSVGAPQIVIVENRKVEEKQYAIEIVKIDGNSKQALTGAEFTLYDSNRTPIETKTTGQNGYVRFVVKDTGTYYVKETKAPDGYDLLKEEFTFNVNETQGVYKREIPNYRDETHIIKVYKKDKTNNAPLADAVFEVFDSAYNKLGELTTTLPDGVGEFKVSKDGTYYLKEKVAPEGYELIEGYIEVIAGATVNVVEKTVYNEKIPDFSITVIKKDKDSQTPLADAMFRVYASDKETLMGTMTTTLPNGSASIKVPTKGTYYLEEVQAPAGYKLIEGLIPVEVDGTANVVEKTIYNEKVQEFFIKVIKKDKVNNAPLADATFQVIDSDKQTIIGTVTTTLPNGSASIKVPHQGTYYLKEIQAPAGYKLIEGLIPVEVGGTANIVEKTIYNEKVPEFFIKVIKKDKVNNAPLADATFEVIDSDKHTVIGTITTTLPNGSASIKVPHKGTFYLKEIKAPAGYTLITGLIPVEVDGTVNVVEKTIYNEKPKVPEYWITVYKKDKVNNAPLADATFKVIDSDKKTVIGTVTTKLPNGSDSIKVPHTGTFYLQEVKAPEGYKLIEGLIPVEVDGTANVVEKTIYNEKNKFFLTVYKKDKINNAPLGDAEFEVYDISNKLIGKFQTQLPTGAATFEVPNEGTYFLKEVKAPNGYTLIQGMIPVTVGGTTNVVEKTIYNEKIPDKPKYIIKVYKKDKVNNAPLSNATFGVYDANKNQIGTFETTIPDGSGVFEVPSAGTYYLKELQAPHGYILKDGFIPVEVGGNVNVVEKTIFNEQEEKPFNRIEILKVDDANNKLSGVKFSLYTKDDKLVETGYTDKNGVLVFDKLEDATYYVKEEETLQGYILDTKEHVIKVKGGETKSIKVVNMKEETNGWLSIRKYIDGTTTPLAGVEFTVTASNGVSKIFTTDSNGSIYITVPVGNYTVQETKTLKGYIMDDTPRTVQVLPNETPKDIVFYNKPANATIVITKIDESTKAPLAGAKFGIFTKDEKLLQTVVTDASGHASLTLPYGDYILREIEAPVGYILDVNSTANLTVDGSKKLIDITVTNSKIPPNVKPPKTGFTGFGGNSGTITGLAVFAGTSLILLNRREIINRLFRR